MKKIIYLLPLLGAILLAASLASARPFGFRQEGSAEEQTLIDAQWFKEHYAKAEYMIPMRDGVKLYTAVYTPKNKRIKSPILLKRTPYGCEPYGKKNSSFWQDSIYHNYLKAEYILVFQDVRGRWMSDGEFENVRPFIENKQGSQDVDEASDAYDTIEWLLRKVKRHNGRVGLYGSSYDGFYALMAAVSGHSAICAVSPQAPVCDWFVGDDFHHNGAFALYDAISFLPNFGLANRVKGPLAAEFDSPLKGDEWEFFMNNTVADITRSLDSKIPFWDAMMQHPSYDDFWQSRNALRAAKWVKAPALVVGGSFDAEDLYGTWSVYKALRENPSTQCRIVVGPWSHGEWRGNAMANSLGGVIFSEESQTAFFRDEIEFPFFDHHLRGTEWSGATELGALVFFSGENCWREMEEWNPEANTSSYRLYLAEDGALSQTAVDMKNSFSSYISDPQSPVPYYADTSAPRKAEYMLSEHTFVESRDDVLTFVSPVLEQDVTLAGAIEAVLYASVSQTDADFIVKVIDVGPDGEYEMMVRGDIIRGRYRNSLSQPEPFTPDKIEQVRLVMADVAHTFMAGHSIKVQVQSSWFPLFDRNPQQFIDIYKATKADFVPCDVRIYHDVEHPSHINFMVMN